MCDRAVVALEEVLRADLPVRLVLGLRAGEKSEPVYVDSRRGDPLGDVLQRLPERRCLEIGVDEHERPPGLELQGDEPELLVL